MKQLVGTPLLVLASNAKANQIKRPLDDKEFHKLKIERCQLGSLKNGSAGELTLTRAVQPEDTTNMQGKTKGRQKGHDCNAKPHSDGWHNQFPSRDSRGCGSVGDDRGREMQMAVVAGISQVSMGRQLVVRVCLDHGGGTSSGAVLVSCSKTRTGQKVAACRYVRRVRRRYLGRRAHWQKRQVCWLYIYIYVWPGKRRIYRQRCLDRGYPESSSLSHSLAAGHLKGHEARFQKPVWGSFSKSGKATFVWKREYSCDVKCRQII